MWNKIKNLIPPVYLGSNVAKGILPIIPFQELDFEKRWNVSIITDSTIGGHSEASFDIIRKEANGQEGETDNEQDENILPRIVFSGNISTMRPASNPKVKHTGFCAFRVSLPSPLDIVDHEGIEIKLRTDGKRYVTNMQITSFIPNQLFQGYIPELPSGKWFTIQLPFRDMTLTRLGRRSELQLDLDIFSIESFGFLIAENQPGPFQMEIAHVSAIEHLTG